MAVDHDQPKREHLGHIEGEPVVLHERQGLGVEVVTLEPSRAT